MPYHKRSMIRYLKSYHFKEEETLPALSFTTLTSYNISKGFFYFAPVNAKLDFSPVFMVIRLCLLEAGESRRITFKLGAIANY